MEIIWLKQTIIETDGQWIELLSWIPIEILKKVKVHSTQHIIYETIFDQANISKRLVSLSFHL